MAWAILVACCISFLCSRLNRPTAQSKEEREYYYYTRNETAHRRTSQRRDGGWGCKR